MRYGRTPPSPPLAYDHRIKSLFFRMIVDPTRFMKKGILRQNFCVLAGIIISIRTSLGLLRGSKQEMENDISALNYQNLFKMGKKGLSLGDLEIIEKKTHLYRINSKIGSSTCNISKDFLSIYFKSGRVKVSSKFSR